MVYDCHLLPLFDASEVSVSVMMLMLLVMCMSWFDTFHCVCVHPLADPGSEVRGATF